MIFYNLIVAPIEMVVDWVFSFFTVKFSAFGIIGAVFGVSLVINFLALPLYNIADSLQAKERKITKMMEPRIKRIKQAFKGDERFMMLQTYYRECNYNPLYALRSSLSILIEIPFFIAAYHYLSHAEVLKGSEFLIFKDLGSPDGLLHIGNFPIHVLPILMTAINLISGAIYSKDTTFREKIQIYVLAGIFLVLLYNSPSGLVIYWILNNLFSLAKNVVMKMKNPKRILYIIISSILGLFACYFLFFNDGAIKKRIALFVICLFVILFPILKKVIARLLSLSKKHQSGKSISSARGKNSEVVSGSTNKQMLKQVQPDKLSKSQFAVFFFSALGLALLCGFYLPTSTISTSPIEFSFLGEGADSPLTYVWSSLSTFLGLFVFWPSIVYFMFCEKVKKWENILFVVLFLSSLANVFIFKANYGTVDVTFDLENASVLVANFQQKVLPFLLIIAIFSIYYILQRFKKLNVLGIILCAVCLSEIVISFSNVSSINKEYIAYSKHLKENENLSDFENNKFKPVYHFSKTGKNVVVLFLDRAINSFFPYAIEEIPELKKQLQGFVYYPNTLSFGTHTVLGSPSMMGGYEYNPENMNVRDSIYLREKHNEASLLLPTLFANAGYESTVTDPPFPNYTWKGDLSAFKNREDISAYELIGKYSDEFKKDEGTFSIAGSLAKTVETQIKNFTILQVLLPILRPSFYGNFRLSSFTEILNKYYNNISHLYYLSKLTDFETIKNQYMFICNETTHSPIFVDEDFVKPNNTKKNHGIYQTASNDVKTHYHTFVATFKQVGKWFDYLRENDVYDNTRIIIVSDHGRNIKLNEFSNFKNSTIPSSYTPILLFKDFNSSSELSTDNTFMTNADTLFLAKEGLGLSDKNPFTNKDLIQEKENGITIYPSVYQEWNSIQIYNHTQFTLDKTKAYHVSDNIFDEANWIPLLEWEKTFANENGGSK